MTEDELRAIVDNEVSQSLGYLGGTLSDQRQEAMRYYYGEPFGNEQEGQSQVVSTDVADTIESVLPQVVKIFTAGDEIVRFDPQGPEDEELSRQVTDYINYLYFRQNKGFLTTYGAIKDGLLQKNAFAKVYWDTYEDYETETYTGLSEDSLALLMQDMQDADVISHEQIDQLDPQTGQVTTTYGMRLRKKRTIGKVCIDLVPPEEVIVNRGATHDIQKCRFIAHRCKKTISDLRLMGFETDGIESDYDGVLNSERQARYSSDEELVDIRSESQDETMREIWITEAYIRVDWDDDGIAELRKVTVAGNAILGNEEIDRIPFVTGTPILMPHKLFGRSVADLVMDLQYIKSHVLRGVLDNMYLTNHSRVAVLDGMVNLDDLLTVRPGGVVRTKSLQAIQPLQPPILGAPAYQLLEYMDTIREVRTGVTRYNQGMDADSLNKTATGVNRIFDASMERILLIARIFAETFFADLFQAMFELVCKHEDKQKMVRLRNKWVPISPREWKSRFDMTVSVGLGTGSQADTAQAMMGVMQIQEKARAGGMYWVTDQNVYNAAIDYARIVNPKKADLYFSNPQEVAPPQPKPDPKIVTTQMKIEAQHQQRTAKMEFDREMRTKEMAIDLTKDAAQKAHEADLAHADHLMGMDKAAADYEADHYRSLRDAGRGTNQS